MIEITDVRVRGLSEIPETRRSFNSTNKGDSSVHSVAFDTLMGGYGVEESTRLGEKDLNLMAKLGASGDSHAKMNRFIDVYFTLNLPRRVWVDFDTYRLGSDNIHPDDIEYFSDSTMHTLGKLDVNETTVEAMFDPDTPEESMSAFVKTHVAYKAEPSEKNFIKMKNALPEGFLQARRMKTNYQALRHIYFDRKAHRQPEFRTLCDWIETLPYAKELILCQKVEKPFVDPNNTVYGLPPKPTFVSGV